METNIYRLIPSNIDFIAKKVSEVLKKGGISVIPTDTIYGIIALDDIKIAIDRIYKIKNRSRDKKLIRLIGDIRLLKRYTEQDSKDLINRYWPGPLTIIFKGKNKNKVAIRYPDNPFLNELFEYLGKSAIVAPSANISGKEELISCDDLINQFNKKVDIIVCYDKPIQAKASTIIDISEENNWKILRQGELKLKI